MLMRGVVTNDVQRARRMTKRYSFSRRWNDFGRVNASSPSLESVQPRPESFTPVHASAGIEVVAAVHEPRAGLDAIADAHARLRVARPDRRGQPVAAVVHERDRFVVVRRRA